MNLPTIILWQGDFFSLSCETVAWLNTSLCCRGTCNLTSVSNVYKAAPRSLFWAPMDLMNYQKCVSNFLLTSLANQQWYFKPVSHDMYSNPGCTQVCGDLEQGFWCCFADRLKELASINGKNLSSTS